MVMESSAGSGSRLLESLEAAEALTFGYSKQRTSENVGKKVISFSRRKTKPEHGATPRSCCTCCKDKNVVLCGDVSLQRDGNKNSH